MYPLDSDQPCGTHAVRCDVGEVTVRGQPPPTPALQHLPTERPPEPLASSPDLSSSAGDRARLADRLEQVLTVLPAGVIVVDAGGRVEHCNPAARALLGEPLAGERWLDIIQRAFAPRLDDGHEVSLKDGRRVSIATESLARMPGQIVLVNDVTETRRLQERLNHHQRLASLGETAASLAHQLRTPLAAAVLYASQLSEGGVPVSQQQLFANKVLARLSELESLIKDMLDFARAGDYRRRVLELDSLIEVFRHTMEPQLQSANGALAIREDVRGAKVLGNREALLGALQNLVNNALQMSPGGCRVRLTTRLWGGRAVDIVVSDDGPGIEPEIQERIFEPFFTTRARGTGLGLSVVRAIARAHQGAAWVDSVPGEGATFTLRLPLIAEPATSEKAAGPCLGGRDEDGAVRADIGQSKGEG